MTTTIEDSQLTAEVQELYIIGKDWIADLDFFEQDLEFIQRLFKRSFLPLIHEPVIRNITPIMQDFMVIETQCESIRARLLAHLHSLEPLVKYPDMDYGLSLIESHASLERDISGLLQSFRSLKKGILKLTEKDTVAKS
jgi:hypothetical protein